MNNDLFDAPKPASGNKISLDIDGINVAIDKDIAAFYQAATGITATDFCRQTIQGFSHDGTTKDGYTRMLKHGKDDAFLEKLLFLENERLINN